MIDRRIFALSAAGAAFVAGQSWTGQAGAKTRGQPVLNVPARSPFLGYEGRTADIDAGVVRAGFPGVVLRIRANAGRLTLKTAASSETVYLDVSIDGAAPQIVHLTRGQQDLVLFDGKASQHLVEITRRNESWQGVWDISGATIDQGEFLPPPALPVKKLMFIGDSITCGEATDVARDNPRQDIAFADAHKSYGKLLAATLGTQCHLVSAGGQGVMRNWQGIRDGTNAPVFYERAAPDEPTKPWDHSTYVPDVIGIALGTNDFSQGIPDQNEFTNAYVEFIEKIRRDAPKARIILIDSPMLNNDGAPKRAVLGFILDDIIRRIASPLVSHAAVKHYAGRPARQWPPDRRGPCGHRRRAGACFSRGIGVI